MLCTVYLSRIILNFALVIMAEITEKVIATYFLCKCLSYSVPELSYWDRTIGIIITIDSFYLQRFADTRIGRCYIILETIITAVIYFKKDLVC